MKKVIFILISCLILDLNVCSQERLFFVNAQSDVCATKDKPKTKVFDLDTTIYNNILNDRDEVLILDLPFFNNRILLELSKFNVYSSNSFIYSKTESGDILLDIEPTILSYKVLFNNQEIGVFNFVNGTILASFKLNGKQYEITEFSGNYILFEASNSINTSSFSCAVDSAVISNSYEQMQIPNTAPSSLPVCVELAIEIDSFTRQTFASNLEAINWAFAIMAGVSQVYEAETNAAIQVVYTYVWNTTDPYSAWVAQSSAMLSELKDYWQINNPAINRDLVHLMTKRSNTGTGGIAYLDALCSTNWGYGFSSDLNNDTTFSFPNPSYTWNLFVCSHEIGHNFGAHHTHWCGWNPDATLTPPFAGGVIDNCVDVEGSCTNNPTPQLGTIMSYCHIGGNGATIDFHEVVVSQALDVGIANASCLTTCDYYGCTDSSAFNYDPNASIDDGSCIAKIFGCLDNLATNFDPLANTDDGSCTYCSEVTIDITNISCFGYNDGEINITINNGTPPYSFNWIGPNGFTSTSEDIINLSSPGTFQVVVEDALQCKDTTQVIMQMPNPINILNFSIDSVSCNGLNDGAVLMNVDGGSPPLMFSSLSSLWSNQNCYTNSDGIDPLSGWDYKDFLIPEGYKLDSVYFDASRIGYPVDEYDFVLEYCPSSFIYSSAIAIEPFNYTLITTSMYNVWTDLTNYNIEDSTNVRVSLPTNAGAVWNNLCFAISPSNFIDNFNSLPYLSAGNYSLTLTDANNCPSVDTSFSIYEASPMQSSIDKIDISCYNQNDGTIDLTISGGSAPFTYLWSGPNGFSSLAEDLTSLTSGQYYVTVTDYNNCSVSNSSNIINPTLFSGSILSSSDVSCSGGNDGNIILDISGGTPPYNYLWSNGAISQSLFNISANNYSVAISDSNGCAIPTIYTNISEPGPSFLTSTKQDVSCYGLSDGYIDITYQPVNNNISYSFLWSDGSVSEDISNLSAGVYSLTITENNTCDISLTILISQPNVIVVQDSINNVSCKGGSDGKVFLAVSGGTPFFSYLWDNGLSSPLPTNLSQGIYIYTITDANGCQYNGSVNIEEPLTNIVITDSLTDASCYNSNDGKAYLDIVGGGPPYQVSWLTSNPVSLSFGTHFFEVLDSYGCLVLDSVYINQPQEINVTNNIIDVKCFGGSSGSANLLISGGFSPYNINWYGYDNNNLYAGNYLYNIIDSNGCVKSGVISVDEPTDIVVSSVVTSSTCPYTNDGSVSFSISGGTPPYSTDWFGVSPLQLAKGFYNFIVLDSNQCIDTNQVIVTSTSDISVQLTLSDVSCFNECDGDVSFLISNGVAPYQLSLTDLNNNYFLADSLCEGEYIYSIIDDLSCEYIDTFTIFSPDLLQLSINDLGGVLSANVTGGSSPYYYFWYDPISYIGNTQQISIANVGDYLCVVVDSNQCVIENTLTISSTSLSNENLSNLLIYPNPVSTVLNIVSSQRIDNIFLRDILGKKLQPSINFKDEIITVDFSGFAKGVYLLILEDKGVSRVSKIMVE